MDASTSPETKPLYRATQVVWYLLWILEVGLVFRFLLKLFGANPAAGFTSFVYAITYPFVAPFLAVFRITVVAGSVFEWTTLLAMLVYWIIAWAIVRLILIGKPVSTPEAARKLEEQDDGRS
ncbi:MAG: YggT family protein [Patescibacteria group bacterium]|nr:YggT family protein [Patescibacteria group bacterium]